MIMLLMLIFNPDPLPYPLKTSENLRFSDDFRGYRTGTLAESGLNADHVFYS